MCISICCGLLCCFFFFKQKTAYEMLRSLVGSEMCIRDRQDGVRSIGGQQQDVGVGALDLLDHRAEISGGRRAVSYTHLTLPTIYSV